jgi:hypothetical protein
MCQIFKYSFQWNELICTNCDILVWWLESQCFILSVHTDSYHIVWYLSQSFSNLLIIKKRNSDVRIISIQLLVWSCHFMTPCDRLVSVITLLYPPWIIDYGLQNVDSNLVLIRTAAYVQVGTTVQIGGVH